MYLPDFLFENQDIQVLKQNKIFTGEYVDKLNNFTYYRLSPIKFNELLDILYSNYKLTDRDIQDVEFDLRTISYIFTAIINKENPLMITSLILQYHSINKYNAHKLMSIQRKIGEDKEN